MNAIYLFKGNDILQSIPKILNVFIKLLLFGTFINDPIIIVQLIDLQVYFSVKVAQTIGLVDQVVTLLVFGYVVPIFDVDEAVYA